MKVVTFRIKGEDAAMREFHAAFEAARQREPFAPESKVYFTSLEAARNFLTPKRLALLRLIRLRKPRSIYDLAKQAQRSFSSVFKDVELLAKHGLVRLAKDPDSARRAVHPTVAYQAINLWISV